MVTDEASSQLDVVVGSMKLDDQFEWDLDNSNASPEDFAEVYAQDLGLGGEFKYELVILARVHDSEVFSGPRLHILYENKFRRTKSHFSLLVILRTDQQSKMKSFDHRSCRP